LLPIKLADKATDDVEVIEDWEEDEDEDVESQVYLFLLHFHVKIATLFLRFL